MRAAGIAGALVAGLLLACPEPEAEVVAEAEPEAQEPALGPDPNAPPSAPVAPTPPTAPSPTELPTSPEPAAPKQPTLELAFVGDVVLGEYVFDEHRSFAGPEAPAYPFAQAAAPLRADILVGNLESPVMQQVPVHSPIRFGHRFGASAAAVDDLVRAGFDVMSLANNHANDLGRLGLEQTPAILRERGIVAAGAARYEGSAFRVETLERGGWRVGFVSAATWLNNAPTPEDPHVPLTRTTNLPDELVPVITAARADHDLVVVLLHWGREKRESPGPSQLHVAHDLVDAGADLVIGHHPHVLQGIERYADGLIAYSLGNFLFPARLHEFRDTGVLRVRWNMAARCPEGATFEPLRLDQSPGHAPRPTTLKERRVILDRIERLGRGLRTRWRKQGDTMVLKGCDPTRPRHAENDMATSGEAMPR